MKKQIRILGLDDGPHKAHGRGKVKVIGAFFRGGDFLDGVLSTEANVDGTDATKRIIDLVRKSKFRPQLQAILIDGIAFGGFNIIDIEKLNKKLGIPVIVVIRRKPDIENIKKILVRIGKRNEIKLIDRAGRPVKIGKIYVQYKGLKLKEVREILKITSTRSYIPEPIRVAHLIAQGLFFGESKGDA